MPVLSFRTDSEVNEQPKPDPAQGPFPPTLHLSAPGRRYDFNFSGGRVREMWSQDVCLMPFVPSLYARKTAEMFKRYPEVNRYRPPKTSTLLEMLEYCEGFRRDETRCLWAIFHINEFTTLQFEPPIEALVGIIGLYAVNRKTMSADVAPLVIFPPYQSQSFAAQATSLMQAYVFLQLRLSFLYANSHAENAASIRLGERMFFRRELYIRACSAYPPPTDPGKAEVEALKEVVEEEEKETELSSAVSASLYWADWERRGKDYAEGIGYAVDSPTRFRNDYKPVPVVVERPKKSIWLARPSAKYDFNFSHSPATLKSSKVRLVPFVPSLHARKLFEIIPSSPEASAEIQLDEALRGERVSITDLDQLMGYLEGRRNDPTACVWSIFEAEAEHSGPKALVGFVVVQRDRRPPRSCQEGNAVIGPLAVSTDCDSTLKLHTLALLARYCLTPTTPDEGPSEFQTTSPMGLGYTRITRLIEPENTFAIELAEKVGFGKEGYSRHALPPVELPVDMAEMGRRSSAIDHRGLFSAFEVYVASMSKVEWEGGQKRWAEELLVNS